VHRAVARRRTDTNHRAASMQLPRVARHDLGAAFSPPPPKWSSRVNVSDVRSTSGSVRDLDASASDRAAMRSNQIDGGRSVVGGNGGAAFLRKRIALSKPPSGEKIMLMKSQTTKLINMTIVPANGLLAKSA
jgi:hypothetical protein